MRFEWLMGAEAFWSRAEADIRGARRRALIQAMSFEGDRTGRAAAAACAASAAADRRVLVDAYTRLVQGDRLLVTALLDPAVRRKARATAAMFERLGAMGVAVRITNPVGAAPLRLFARNHKKLIVADDVAYLGGVNFADHNFAWGDFMLRIEGSETADFLAADFDATFAGAPQAASAEFGGLRLITLNGAANRAGFAPVFDLIAKARRAIVVLSPYPTFPFTTALAAASGRGVAVRLIAPAANNKPIVDRVLGAAARNGRFDLRFTEGMSHLKAMLIDDATLIVGSANFDFVSHAAEEELVAMVTDPGAVAAFRETVLEPEIARAVPARGAQGGAWLSRGILRLAWALALMARRSRRGSAPWPARAAGLRPRPSPAPSAALARHREDWPGARS